MTHLRTRRAFTLNECWLLLLLFAGGLLLIVPVLSRMQVTSTHPPHMQTFHTLETACEFYKNDFGQFPPSSPKDNEWGLEGRYALVAALVGKQQTKAGRLDDGYPGLGFKVHPNGRIYGPYAGCEDVPLVHDPKTGLAAFDDGYGNPVYYYRADRKHATHVYDPSDNTGGPDGLNGSYTKVLNEKGDRVHARKDFILCSPGENGVWQEDHTDGDADDATNFLDEG